MNTRKKISLRVKDMLKVLPDRVYINLYYFAKFKRFPNLENPTTFNEKLQQYKLRYHNPLLHKLVDKYEVREFVADKIGSGYLVPLLAIEDSISSIQFTDFPSQFVLKCTHDSVSTIIVLDKEKLIVKDVEKRYKTALKRDWYWQGREWAYRGIHGRVIAEELMIQEGRNVPDDYKVFCFDGQPALVGVYSERFTGGFTRRFYNIDWTPRSDDEVDERSAFNSPPTCLQEMLELSAKLSEGFPHVRVDWYIISGKLYFGELTFYSAGGFNPFPDDEDAFMGELFDVCDWSHDAYNNQ